MSKKLESYTGSNAPTCSRSFDDLMDSLDAWIEDALKGSKPIGLTLSRARVTITDQRDRIGEIFDALECQNKEVERLRNAIRNLRDVSGRHHTQIACERLFALLPENVKAHIRATEDSQNNQTDGGALCDASCSASSFVTTEYASRFRANIVSLLWSLDYNNANSRHVIENGGIRPHRFIPCDQKTANLLKDELSKLLNIIPEPPLAMDLG